MCSWKWQAFLHYALIADAFYQSLSDCTCHPTLHYHHLLLRLTPVDHTLWWALSCINLAHSRQCPTPLYNTANNSHQQVCWATATGCISIQHWLMQFVPKTSVWLLLLLNSALFRPCSLICLTHKASVHVVIYSKFTVTPIAVLLVLTLELAHTYHYQW